MVRLILNATSSTSDNALFGEALKHWLRRNGSEPKWGAVIISLEDDGFSILQLGPTPISGRQLVEWLTLIAAEANQVDPRDLDG